MAAVGLQQGGISCVPFLDAARQAEVNLKASCLPDELLLHARRNQEDLDLFVREVELMRKLRHRCDSQPHALRVPCRA